jgi:hypothetical protein
MAQERKESPDEKKTSASRSKKKKYWRQVKHGPFYYEAEPGMTGTSVWAHHDEYGSGTTLGYHCIAEPGYYVEKPHSHEYHELLCFLGGDPTNINDFRAEIRVCLGEEQEEHIITTPTIVSLPPGLKHCPLEVTRCDKPIVFLEISTTGEYVATGADGQRVDRYSPE